MNTTDLITSHRVIYYSAFKRGFYDTDVHGANIPEDAVQITTDDYEALLSGQANGQQIVPGKDGKPVLVSVIPTPEQQLATFISAIQTRLDEFAQTRGYANILSATTYANSTMPRFAAEGQYALRIRDETWIRGYALMDEVKAGTRPMPATVEELFALLPKLEWPK